MVGDGSGGDDANDGSALLRTEVVQLSRAFEIITDTVAHDGDGDGDGERQSVPVNVNNDDVHVSGKQIISRDMHSQRRVRIIHPYPFTFATFAKARWIGRTVVDIYHEEFGKRWDFDTYVHYLLICLHQFTHWIINFDFASNNRQLSSELL